MQKIGLEAVLEMAKFNQGKKAYTDGLDQMGDRTSRASKIMGGLGNILGGLAKAGIGAAVVGFGALTGAIASSVKEAAAAQQVEAQLDAVLKSTGGAAGMTKDEILGLADALSQVTPFEDDVIAGAETMLLQFKAIGEDVFPQATEMALDLAQRLGMDAASAAKLLGKALEEPGEGLLRLKQAGVAFTDEQEAMIKAMVEAGDAAGAQKFIMDELEKSVGGAARAAGETFAGKMEILQNKIGNVKEAIGTAFLPVLSTLVDKFSEFVTANGPAIEAFFQDVADFIVEELIPAFETLAGWVQDNLVPAFETLIGWVQDNITPAFKTLAALLTETLLPALKESAEKIGTAFQTLKDALSPLMDDVAAKGPAFTEFWTALASVGLDQLAEPVHALAEAMGGMAEEWPQFKAILDEIAAAFAPEETKISQQSVWVQELGRSFSELSNPITTAWTSMKNIKTTMEELSKIANTIVTAIEKELPKAFKSLTDWADDVVTEIGKLPGKITAWANSVVSTIEDSVKKVGKSIVDGIKAGIEDAWDAFMGWVLDKVGGIIGSILASIGGGSPAKAFMPIGQSMAQGVAAGWEKAVANIGGGLGFSGMALSPATVSNASTSNSFGGDTFVFNVSSPQAWGMAQRWVEARNRERLNVRM